MAKGIPHLDEGEILWLDRFRKAGNPHYFMRTRSGWTKDHATKIWSSQSAQRQAKEYFPKWISDVDPNNENVTLLDEHQRGFLKDYKLDFVLRGWSRIWCHDWKEFHREIIENDHEHERINKISKWVSEWLYPEGHILYSEPHEIRWIVG